MSSERRLHEMFSKKTVKKVLAERNQKWCECDQCKTRPHMQKRFIAQSAKMSFDPVETRSDWVHNQINHAVLNDHREILWVQSFSVDHAGQTIVLKVDDQERMMTTRGARTLARQLNAWCRAVGNLEAGK